MTEIVNPMYTLYNTGVYYHNGKFYDRYKLEISVNQAYNAVYDKYSSSCGAAYATQQADAFLKNWGVVTTIALKRI